VGIPGAELNVVADHEQGHTLTQEALQDLGKHLLELCIQPLGRLIHQQDLRPQQEHFCQSRPLLFTAGQIIGVPIQ